MEHKLIKTESGYYCSICQKNWKGKPRKSCAGTVTEKYSEDRYYEFCYKYYKVEDIKHLNKIPITKAYCLEKGKERIYFYDREGKTELINPDLPPVLDIGTYTLANDPDLPKLESHLKKLNLKPSKVTKPVNCTSHYFKLLYDPQDPTLEPYYKPFARKIIDSPGQAERSGYLTEAQLRARNLKPKAEVAPIAGFWSQNKQDWLFFWSESECEIDDLDLPPILGWNRAEHRYINQKNLHRYNLKIGNAKPVACNWNGIEFDLYYKKEDCQIIDESLPQVFRWDRTFNQKTEGRLKTDFALKKLNLKPGEAEPRGVVYQQNSSNYQHKQGNFVFLYDIEEVNTPYFEKEIPEIDPYCYAKDLELIKNLFDSHKLERNNLKFRGGATPVYRYWAGEDWQFVYALPQLETDDLNLPPIVTKYPQKFYRDFDLKRLNRRIKATTKPAVCYYQNGEFKLFYNPEDCAIIDRDLPPCYDQNNLPPDLKSAWAWEQSEPMMKLRANPEVSGCIKNGKKIVNLYHRSQLELHNQEVNISQTKLKKIFGFNDYWLEKLGKPDSYELFTIHRRSVRGRMYLRSRVERFLLKNSAEYLNYLNNRKSRPELFNNINIEGYFQELDSNLESRNKLKTQQEKCLACASSVVTERGLFCVVYPLGIKKIPCPDWNLRG